jgi:hypothetical protein
MEPVTKRRGRPRKIDTEINEVVSNRPPMRAEMREPDPRTAAAKRAQEILGNIGQVDDGVDDYRTPKAPDGWTYEWKRKTILNQEDPAYMTALARTGWEPVPATRHPEMMPIGAMHSIERKGMILMERPAEITRQFEEADKRRARLQMRAKEEQLGSAPQGQFERNHAQAAPKINKSYEPMPIPKD